jgi:hypothetical protein
MPLVDLSLDTVIWNFASILSVFCQSIELESTVVDHLRRKFPCPSQDLTYWRQAVWSDWKLSSVLLPNFLMVKRHELYSCELCHSKPSILLLDAFLRMPLILKPLILWLFINEFEGGVVSVSQWFPSYQSSCWANLALRGWKHDSLKDLFPSTRPARPVKAEAVIEN